MVCSDNPALSGVCDTNPAAFRDPGVTSDHTSRVWVQRFKAEHRERHIVSVLKCWTPFWFLHAKMSLFIPNYDSRDNAFKKTLRTTVPLIQSVGTVLDSITQRNTEAAHRAQKLTWASWTQQWTQGSIIFIKTSCWKVGFLDYLTCVAQLTVWQVEDAVVQLKARPCEGHLRRHDYSGRSWEQEEALAVGLQTPGTTQSGQRWRHQGLAEMYVFMWKQQNICGRTSQHFIAVVYYISQWIVLKILTIMMIILRYIKNRKQKLSFWECTWCSFSCAFCRGRHSK